MKMAKRNKGFTLIELLVVITIIGILAATIFVAIDPAKRFAQSRNGRRYSEISAVLDAILTFSIDNKGNLPANIDSVVGTAQILGTAATGCDSGCTPAGTTVAACADLTTDLVDKYLAAIPIDPKDGTASKTLYAVNKTANGRIKIFSCSAEDGEVINVQR